MVTKPTAVIAISSETQESNQYDLAEHRKNMPYPLTGNAQSPNAPRLYPACFTLGHHRQVDATHNLDQSGGVSIRADTVPGLAGQHHIPFRPGVELGKTLVGTREHPTPAVLVLTYPYNA